MLYNNISMAIPLSWSHHKQLLAGSFYPAINEYPTFTHFKSRFPQAGYNFIQPLVPAMTFDWIAAENLMRTEHLNSVEVSFYLQDKIADSYVKKLFSDGWLPRAEEMYVGKSLNQEHQVDPLLTFEYVTKDNFAMFSKIVTEVFPDYDNNQDYCQFCLEQSDKRPADFVNIMLNLNGEYVAFGSILMSSPLGIGFLHNMGTIKSIRDKGYFFELVKYLANIAYAKGIGFVYANTDVSGEARKGFLRLGFEDVERFWIYSRK